VLKHKSADCKMSSPMLTIATPSKSGTATTATNPATSSSAGKNVRTNERQQLCSFTHYYTYFVGSLWLPVVFFAGSTTVPMLQCPLYVRSKFYNLFRRSAIGAEDKWGFLGIHSNEWVKREKLSDSSPKNPKQETDFLPLPYKRMLN